MAACSSARRIEMVHHGSDTASFIWTLNEDSLLNNPFFLSQSTTLRFDLTAPGRRRISLSFGEGSWSLTEVVRLTGFLRSLEVVLPNSRLRLDSLPQLQAYLLARRSAFGNRIRLSTR